VLSDRSNNNTNPTTEYLEKVYVSNNSIIASKNPFFPKGVSFAYLDEESVLQKIIYCESGGNHTAQNPNSTAFGLCQFLDSTWNYVNKKWGLELKRNNYDDQLYACKRLLEEEGLEKHWKESLNCIYAN
jgi:soluble lytic murein transglycosylase-like protein